MTSSIARMNCFLHGIEDFQIVRGDTLADALSAWLESSQQIRQALDALLRTPTKKKKVRS
jgi:type I restriction-modification system DNA methylase subunit